MKLMFCPTCRDIRQLHYQETVCACGRSKGRYLNSIQAAVTKNARVIGIANSDLTEALERPDHPTLRCWLMSKDAPHVRYD